MNDICVSLETAKKLKEAGWGHTTYFTWHGYSWLQDGIYPITKWRLSRITKARKTITLPAPTASEIVAVAPEALTIVRHTGTWNAAVEGLGTRAITANADTMADALAELWLELRKEVTK